LGERILQEYPALDQFDDAVSPRIEGLLRKPFPAQTIAIKGVARRWQSEDFDFLSNTPFHPNSQRDSIPYLKA
jgi:hypothetical protein